ncbi:MULTISPECIES: DUF6744 family protein [Oceanobacillus]|uniref:DUF6744 family protein n=1 Tax=Oceanobacillus TaxID=182709 RepID=UPI000596036D|nr:MULTISPECIES: DUF6744 family protein [Oceanobacillus]
MVNIDNLAAMNNLNKNKSFLGHLIWYSVGKNLIKVEDLENYLINAGLGKEWMPKKIRSSDAFRRATKEVERKRPTSQPTVYENVLVREVYSNQKEIQRNVVIETVDQQGKSLTYATQSAVINLDKRNDSITFTADNDTIKEICGEAETKFTLYKNHYSAQQLRVMVGKILGLLAPTPLRKSGGVWFVPTAKDRELNQFFNFINTLENSEAYKVPVINTNDNKNMVTKKIYEHFQSLLHDCQNKPNLSKAEIKSLINEANRYIADYRNYKTIVSNENEALERVIMDVRKEVSAILMDIND